MVAIAGIVAALCHVPPEQAAQPPPATATPTIKLEPADPGELPQNPSSWSTVAVVTGLPAIKWAVFHEDTAGAHTSDDTWHELAVPADGRVPITVPALDRAREYLNVKSLDETVGARSGLVSFPATTTPTVPQPAPSNDHEFAAAWLADKTMGLNVERNKLLYENRITDAVLRHYAASGVSLLRFFASSRDNGSPLMSQSNFRNLHLEGVKRALAAGIPGVHLDCMGVVYPDHMDEAEYAWVEECAKSIAAYGFDPTRVIVGVANEWGDKGNAAFEPIRNRAIPLLRKHLPNFILVDSAGKWGDPWELCYGGFKPLADRRIIHQWHQYNYDADKFSAADGLRKDLEKWRAATGRLTYCGEWGIGPPSGERAQLYDLFPATMDAAFRGMGQERVAMWVASDGTFWRLNKSGSDAYLRDEIVAKFKEGDAYIRKQPYFGAATAAPAKPPGTIDSIAPLNPGTLTEATAGAGVKVRHVVKTTGISRIKHVVFRGDAGNSWRADAEVDTTGEVAIEPTYFDTGDQLKVMDALNLSVFKDGGAATVVKAGTSTPAPTPITGGAATVIDLFVRGQSNAGYLNRYGADDRLAAMLQALTGVRVNLISRQGLSTGDNNQHGGTSHAWMDPYDPNFGRWMTPTGASYASTETKQAIDYTSDPKGWASHTPLVEALNAVSRFRSTDPNSVFVDCRLHQEYDWVAYGGGSDTHYRGYAWEMTERVRAAAGKAAGRHFVVYLHCPYTSKPIRAVNAVSEAWRLDEAERGVIVAGNMMDADHIGDEAHWSEAGPNRSVLRVALAIASRLWNAGLLPSTALDLSDLPSRGSEISSATKAAARSVTAAVRHNGGTALQAQNASGTIEWGAFECTWDGGRADATGGSISAGNQVTLSFGADIGANPRLHYCRYPAYRGDRLLIDNWHTLRPAKYANVPNIAAVVMPLRRTLAGVPVAG